MNGEADALYSNWDILKAINALSVKVDKVRSALTDANAKLDALVATGVTDAAVLASLTEDLAKSQAALDAAVTSNVR